MKPLKLAAAMLMLMLSAPLLPAKERQAVEPSYAWTVNRFGERQEASIDTLLYNYFQLSVPSQVSTAYATTGNLGTEGLNMIYADRQPRSQFWFRDALAPWLPSSSLCKFYNTRIPMTLMSYNLGGGRDTEQNRLKAVFSGNVNRRLQIGANLDYIYSRGSYNYQAAKDLIWGFNGSYMGERWQIELSYNHWNMLNKENGGITNPLYITDPAQLQGGDDRINSKSIPTRLTSAHTRLVGGRLFMANAYNLLGFWRETQVDDTTTVSNYIPAATIVWTLDYSFDKHIFYNTSAAEGHNFWEHNYLNYNGTRDNTRFRALENVAGLRLEEGINRWVPFGLLAYARHRFRRYVQTPDTIPHAGPDRPEDLTPWPEGVDVPHAKTQNMLWVGARLASTRGRIITFDANAEFGLLGAAVGEVALEGNLRTRFPLRGDSVAIAAFARFENRAPDYLMNNYVSNHYIWSNSFGKTRDLRIGGRVDFPLSRTAVDVLVDNVQNAVYFGPDAVPIQAGNNVQVVSVRLHQDFKAGILNWRNVVTFQTSTDSKVIPLPKLAVYTNLFLQFKLARVLEVQLGVDCDYYTRYYAPGYQPSAMAFYNQRETMVGNYPFMNAYANMKLRKARFYVLFSHVNQGWFGKDYFSMPGYPVNPRRFQLGVAVDFAN